MAEHRTYTEGNENRGFRGECSGCDWRGERRAWWEAATTDRRAHERRMTQQTAEPSEPKLMNGVYIPLGGKGAAVVLVDAADAEWLSQWVWHMGSVGYARRGERVGRRMRAVLMHRVILGIDSEGNRLQGDHINGDRLDNRRSNLRVSTHGQNQMNRGRTLANTSGFKGVSRDGDVWRSGIRLHGRTYHLGRHATPEEAAMAYDAKARELHGEFAWVNFPMAAQAA